MASPTVRQTARTAQLAQNLFDSGSDTSISITVASDNNWNDQAGVVKIGTGSSSEWVSFTGVTTVSATKQTLTGCVRGLDKDATSLSDATSSNKKTNSIGTTVKLVHHSAEMNKLLQKDADEVVTGTLTYNNNTTIATTPPSHTTVELSTITKPTGSFWYNETDGKWSGRTGGNDVDFGMSTPTSFATTSAAGVSQVADSTNKQALNATDPTTGAPLFIRNDDTERTLHPSNTNTTDTMVIGGGSTGDRATSFSLDGSDTNDGFVISRASGANGTTTITSNGTGDVDFVSGNAISFTSAASADISFTPGSGGNVIIDGPVTFGTNGGYVAEAFTAGETLAAGDWVYFKSSDSKAWKASNAAESTATVLGVVITGGAADATVYIQTSGVYTTTGLTADTEYYLNTGGALTATKPSIDSLTVIPVLVGRSLSTTKLQIINKRQQRVVCDNTTISGITSSSTTDTITVGIPIDRVEFNYVYANGNHAAILNSYFQNNAAQSPAQQSVGFRTAPSGVVSATISQSYGIHIFDLLDTGDAMRGTVSIDGSNNILITWSQVGTFTLNTGVTINYTVYEAL